MAWYVSHYHYDGSYMYDLSNGPHESRYMNFDHVEWKLTDDETGQSVNIDTWIEDADSYYEPQVRDDHEQFSQWLSSLTEDEIVSIVGHYSIRHVSHQNFEDLLDAYDSGMMTR